MVALAEASAVLERTPHVIRSLLGHLPTTWTEFRTMDESWSPYDVLGHLIHGERTDWVPRIRIIVTHGSAQAFTPFDREGMRDNTDDVDALLGTFASAREQSLTALRDLDLTPDDLTRVGSHPDLGTVTLGELLASWVVHDLSHVAQIAETMAKRYRTDIGPWRAYLPVVDRLELPD